MLCGKKSYPECIWRSNLELLTRMLCDNQARYVGNAAVLLAPGRAQWFGEVFSPNSIALLSMDRISEREEWNTCGGTCTYAFRYLMGCFYAVSTFALAQNEAEKIYKKSKKCIALLCRVYYTIHIEII